MAYDASVPVNDTTIAALPDAIRTKGVSLKELIDAHVAKSVSAHVASAIASTATGNISATNVQAAIAELDTEKQPKDATLTALAALTTAANQLIYSTGVDTFSMATLTAFARTLLDDADAETARATLGAAPLASPTFTGTVTAPTLTVTTTLNIPGGKIWIA